MSHHDNPGQGNLGEINGFAVNQASRVSKSNEIASQLGTLVSSTEATEWTSEAGAAWRERVTRVVPSASAAAEVAQRWDEAAKTYMDTVGLIAAQGAKAARKIDSAHQGIYSYSHLAAEVGGVQAKIDEFEEDIREANRLLWALSTQRNNADSAFASTLNYHSALNEGRDWTALQGLYSGVTTLNDLDAARAEAVAEAVALADAIEALNPSSEDVDALASLLTTMTSDPELASAFWQQRGGDDTLDLLGAGLQVHMSYPDGGSYLSEEDATAALLFARAVRESLAAGSSTWDQEYARDFAAQMITGDDWPGGTYFNTGKFQGVGFLFDDAEEHPMGEHLTVAMADLLDARERGGTDAEESSGPTVFDSTTAHGVFATISQTDERDRGGYTGGAQGDVAGVPSRDPMSRVLDTLGTYPDAAWDWLTADGGTLANGLSAVPNDKVEYYATRDWSSDGWDGFGALWEGSMEATGGFTSDTYSPLRWIDMSDLYVRVMEGLASAAPDTFASSSISEAGATNLGLAISHTVHLALAESASEATSVERPDNWDGPSFIMREVIGLDGVRPIPSIDNAALARVWGTVGGTDQGLSLIYTAIHKTEIALYTEADGIGTKEAWDAALQNSGKLNGTFAGSLGGIEILAARLQDAEIQSRIDAASFVAGLVPVPGIDELPRLAEVGVSAAIGHGVDSAAGAVSDRYAANEATAIDEKDADKEAAKDAMDSTFRDLIDNGAWNLRDIAPVGIELETWIGTVRSTAGAFMGDAVDEAANAVGRT